jgi:hypothetical protein
MSRAAGGTNETPARFTDAILDEDGLPPCAPPDACATCRLFSTQRPGEDRAEWLERVIGAALGLGMLEIAS